MDEGRGPTEPTVTPGAPPERKMSRAAAFAAMAVVAFAIILLTMLAPGSGVDPDAPPPGTTAENAAAPPASLSEPGASTEADRLGDAAIAGKDAPLNFTLKDMNGVNVRLESFKGKVILVNFWAKWCGPCRVEIPDLVELQTEYKDDLVILGILVQDRWDDKVAPFAAQLKINYPLLDASERTDVEEAFGPMWGLPTTFIIGRDGKIARKRTGMASKEYFEQEIRALL